MNLAVIGAGKLGFPVAAYYANRGATVVAVDTAPDVVAAINKGTSPIGFEPGASEHVETLVAAGRLQADTSYDAISTADVVVVLVPLLAHGGSPDFSILDASVDEIAKHVRADATVIFETTLPVGTTRRRFTPKLREQASSVRVAFSPERVYSGRIWRDLETYPKLVGGVDEASTESALAFYEQYLEADVWPMASVETAELVKLAETTYRDINIAFANELARFADEWGADVRDVIRAANSQPYSHIHRPGVGVGGHCIPHYPYLLQRSTSGSKLIETARSINERMPEWVVDRVTREIGSLGGHTALLLGVAYRGGVKETASSPAFGLQDALQARGATVIAADPCYTSEELDALGFTARRNEQPDVIIVVTDHDEYRTIDWSRFAPALVVDGRNILDGDLVRSFGHRYLGVGIGSGDMSSRAASEEASEAAVGGGGIG